MEYNIKYLAVKKALAANKNMLLVCCVMAFGACSEVDLQLTDYQEIVVINLPSGSGITKAGAHFYAIGDDAPYLYQLNNEFQIGAQFVLIDTAGYKGGKIPKKQKPDFEALEYLGLEGILVLGSGSKSPQRDRIVLIDPTGVGAIETPNAAPFFDYLRNHPAMEGAALNIEAVALHQEILWVGNRGKNLFFGFDAVALIAALRANTQIPAAQVIALNLPSIAGIAAGLSGAVAMPHQNKLIFTASVEGTDDTYNDGAILGSFVGVLDLDAQEVVTVRVPETAVPLKIESVAIDSLINSNEAEILMLTDDDYSLDSKVIKAKLRWF